VYEDATGYWPVGVLVTCEKLSSMCDNSQALDIQLGSAFHGVRFRDTATRSDHTELVYEASYFLPVTGKRSFDRLKVKFDQDVDIGGGIPATQVIIHHCFYVRAVTTDAAISYEERYNVAWTASLGAWDTDPDGNWESPELVLSSYHGFTLWFYWAFTYNCQASHSFDVTVYGRPILYMKEQSEPTTAIAYVQRGTWESVCFQG